MCIINDNVEENDMNNNEEIMKLIISLMKKNKEIVKIIKPERNMQYLIVLLIEN